MVKKGKGKISRIPHKTSSPSIRLQAYSGPIPPASELEKYETGLPGSANRIIKMAEDQKDHRIDIEKQVINSQVKDKKRGQIFAFCLGIAGILASVIIAYLGYPASAVVFGSGTIVALVTVFLVGQTGQQKNSENKK